MKKKPNRMKGPSRWTVIGTAPTNKYGYRQVVARCECGNVKTVTLANIRNGISKSCGCYRVENTTTMNLRHGQSIRKDRPASPTYKVWVEMIRRCEKSGRVTWEHYGERGITVCERWRASFDAFLADMGDRPSGTSIDRIDVNGHYEPGNCRWATSKEQARNKRTSRRLTYAGRTATVVEWSEITGIDDGVIRGRLDRGWSVEDALTRPVQKHARKPKERAA